MKNDKIGDCDDADDDGDDENEEEEGAMTLT